MFSFRDATAPCHHLPVPAVLLVLLAAVCFGTTGTAQSLGPEADPTALGAARIALGGGLLGVLALIRARRTPPPGSRGAMVAVLLGGAGVLAYQPTFFAGTAANGVAVGTVVALGSAPVLTGLLGWVLTRRAPSGRWAVATACATVGVVLLGLADGDQGALAPLGLLASVGAGASYAVYTLAAKDLLDRGWSPTLALGAPFGTAALGGVVVLATSDTSGLGSAGGLATVLWLGVVTTAVAYLLFGAGLALLPAATVATLTLVEPVTAGLLGVLLLGERLPVQGVVGIVVLAAGIAVLALGARRQRVPATVTP